MCPSQVLIMAGTNDLKRRTAPEITSSLEQLHGRARAFFLSLLEEQLGLGVRCDSGTPFERVNWSGAKDMFAGTLHYDLAN